MVFKRTTQLGLMAVLLLVGLSGCSQSLQDRQTRGAVIGGVAGAAVGSLFGGGTGRVITTGAGAVLGSIAGAEIAGR
jgi:uncharacterized protein YcfJ